MFFSNVGRGQATDLFISEYVEGSSSNKYIEIYNGTGAAINLADYQLLLFSNGSPTATTTNTLSGTLNNLSTIVYQNSGAVIYGGATTNASSVNFNGDDAIALYKISTASYVDIIGNIGCDPGSAWTSGTSSTANKTLVRNANICGGVTIDPATSCPFPTLASEWTVSAQDDVSNLGSHTNTCVSCTGPTAQATFTSITVITSSSMTINFATGTGGNGRIVVISNAAITATPTSGTTYAANTVYGSGTDIGTNEFVIYDGNGTSVTVTGLSYNTTYYVQIFEYVTGGTTSPCYDGTTNSNTGNTTTLCAPTTEPTTAASSILFSTVDCTYMIIDWTTGNGGNAIVVVSTSAITGAPADQTSYTANSTFGSGSTLNAGEYVVYNGNGTSVTVLGLVAGTTYFVEIFEYNVTTSNCDENYLTSTTVSSNQATASVCCPQINSILVNSCGASTSEGIDEQVIFQTGSNAINVNDISITYPFAGTYCNTTCATNTNINNAAYVTSLNTLAGCSPDLFYYSDPIPANSTVIMFTGNPPSTTIDYSGVCGSGPYYVVFNNNTGTTGRYANNANANRTTTMSFGGGCSQTVTFYSSNANTGTDGDYAYFDALGNVSYGNNGLCVAGPLPVELLNFDGYGNNSTNFLNWSTASEINNDYFDIERSSGGINFENIGMIYGNGTTTYQNDYSFIDETPFPSLNYYRLKQVDFNGSFEYSNTIAIKSEIIEFSIWQANDFLHISTSKEVKNIKNISIYSALGQLIYTTNNSSISLINTSHWEKGIYLVQIQTENSSFTKKIQFK